MTRKLTRFDELVATLSLIADPVGRRIIIARIERLLYLEGDWL